MPELYINKKTWQNKYQKLNLKIMKEPKKNKKTKKELKELINKVKYLSDNEKEDIYQLIEILDQEQKNELYSHFKQSLKDEEKGMVGILYKHDLGDAYFAKLKQIEGEAKKEMLKKQEEYEGKNQKKAEDILDKLDEFEKLSDQKEEENLNQILNKLKDI
jgi:uncharacterized protein with von Willebrand factor type A (vWA) domain